MLIMLSKGRHLGDIIEVFAIANVRAVQADVGEIPPVAGDESCGFQTISVGLVVIVVVALVVGIKPCLFVSYCHDDALPLSL